MRYGIAFCALFLLACGGADAPTVRSVDLEQVDPTGQQVTFWYQHTLQREELLKQMLAEYTATNPHGIEVRGEYAGNYRDIFNKMLVGMQGGVLPDLVVAYNNQAYTYYSNGGAIDLVPYMDSPQWGLSASARADYFPSFLREDNFDGAQVALTPNRSLEVMYYNVDWLREMGYAQPPERWEDFAEMCRRARNRPFSGRVNEGQSTGFMLDDDASQLASLVFSRGGRFMDEARLAYRFNGDEVRASLELVRQLKREGAAALKIDEGADMAGFATGNVLCFLASSTGIPYVKNAVDAGARFTWVLAPPPRTVADPVVNIYGASIALAKSTPERQLASWLFLKWFTEPAQQARWVEVSGYFPVRRSTAESLAAYMQSNPEYARAYGWLDNAQAEPGVMGYERVRRLVAQMMVSVLEDGDLTAELVDLDEKANATLSEF